MKFLIALSAVFFTAGVFAQRLPGNRMPDDKSIGIKANYNFYFPSVIADGGYDVSGNTNSGYGAGLYFRMEFNDRFSFQPELMLTQRSSSFKTSTASEPAPEISITRTTESIESAVNIEVPLYFKMRWELISTRRGHWKWSKAVGFMVGPRVNFNIASSRTQVSNEITRLYNQESIAAESTGRVSASSYYAPFSAGLAIGADIEFAKRFICYANFYRGLTSMNKKEFGYRTFDNRVEVGLGIRFH